MSDEAKLPLYDRLSSVLSALAPVTDFYDDFYFSLSGVVKRRKTPQFADNSIRFLTPPPSGGSETRSSPVKAHKFGAQILWWCTVKFIIMNFIADGDNKNQ
jgi:hypothetical protein